MLDLSREEALVLFECVSRWQEQDIDRRMLPFVDHMERWMFWSFTGDFESILVEPFDPNYGELLDRARAAVRQGAQ